jgi:hypothetical protein
MVLVLSGNLVHSCPLYTQIAATLSTRKVGRALTDRTELAVELQSLLNHIRSHLPDAVVSTRLVHADDESVIVHAQLVGGERSAIGVHASASAGEGAAELAENRAVIRAMIAAGLPAMIDDLPPRLRSIPDGESASRVVQFPKPEAEVHSGPETTIDGEEPEDISWTAFWRWARSAGYADKAAVEAAIGQTINNLTPGEIRKLLVSS